jgi:pilus assembly protein CpaE
MSMTESLPSGIGSPPPSALPPGDREPTRSAASYVLDEETEMAMLRSFSSLGFDDTNVRRGSIDTAIADLSHSASPRVLVVDVSGIADPMTAINRLADVCNPRTEVIVVGDRNDIVLYRDMKAAGVAEYFFKPLISSVLTRALNKLAQGSPEVRPSRTGKVILALGVRGGVGTTTIATQLAWHLAEERQRRVLLLDLDLQSGDAALQLDAAPNHALREALEHPDRIDDLFLERAITQVTERLSLFAALEPLAEEAAPSEDAVMQLLAALARRYRFVIVDLNVAMALHVPKLIQAANTILLVSDGTLISARETVRWRERIGVNSPHRTTLHVLNKHGADGALPDEELDRALVNRPDVSIPYDRELARTAVLGTKAIQVGAGVRRSLAALTRELAGVEGALEKTSLWKRVFG